MTIDASTPRSRRAVLLGALGGLAATIAGFAKAPATRAGVDGDLVLETTNNTDALTELVGSSAPALRVVGGGVGLQAWGGIALDAFGDIAVNAISDSTSAPANIGFNRGNSVGVLGWSADGNESSPTVPAKTGVFGLAEQDSNSRGVLGKTGSGQGVRGEASTGSGVAGIAGGGIGVEGLSSSGSVGVRGSAGATSPPAVPAATGVQGFGPTGVLGSSGVGLGVSGVSGDPNLVTVYAKTGVFGFAAQDSLASGVFGQTTIGAGIRGEATSGVGVRAVATTGKALDVAGRAVFSRSGRVNVPANAKYVDVTVPGGLPSGSSVLATLQYKRGQVHVLAARPNYPALGKCRIYLSDVASTTASTPLAWFVLG
jgi:hypothetical protein